MKFLIIGLVLVVLGILFIVLGEKEDVLHPAIIGCFCILFGLIAFCYGINEMAIKEAEKCATWYLDGEKVDKDKYDLHLYSFTFDAEKGVVYLTRKR